MAEHDWIARYFKPLAIGDGAARLSDDVAVLKASTRTIVTTDTLVEGIHFLPADPERSIGAKLVAVNVSDIIAKGALPKEALLNLCWDARRNESGLAEFAKGFGDALGAWGIGLLGGDTTSHEGPRVLSLTVTGQVIGRGPVRRSGGKPGDSLWVTGRIGAGALGLRAARGAREYAEFLSAYRNPQPPPEAAAELIARNATASMDVSDGLLIDAARLAAASACGASLDLDRVPFAGPASTLDDRLLQVTGGDDYQALFAAPPGHATAIRSFASENGIQVSPIGQLVAGTGLSIVHNEQAVNLPESLGFEHQ
ncbi:MAG: thiamine-phosphate kinase [Pseudomonadota bacterium]